MAALWMAGWLALMLIVAILGRETTRELNVSVSSCCTRWSA
jgi:hypothetical protein